MSFSLVLVYPTPLIFSDKLVDSCVHNMDLLFFLDLSGTCWNEEKLYVVCSVPCVRLWLVSPFLSFRSLMSRSLMVSQWPSLLSSVTMTPQAQFTTNRWRTLSSLKVRLCSVSPVFRMPSWYCLDLSMHFTSAIQNQWPTLLNLFKRYCLAW